MFRRRAVFVGPDPISGTQWGVPGAKVIQAKKGSRSDHAENLEPGVQESQKEGQILVQRRKVDHKSDQCVAPWRQEHTGSMLQVVAIYQSHIFSVLKKRVLRAPNSPSSEGLYNTKPSAKSWRFHFYDQKETKRFAHLIKTIYQS